MEFIYDEVERDRPLFQESGDDNDGNEDGFTLGGIATLRDPLRVARAYREAAECLIQTGLKGGNVADLADVILFSYRHMIELYLKLVTGPVRRHELKPLVDKLEVMLIAQDNRKLADWAQKWLIEFANLDPTSMVFRYADAREELFATDERWVDVHHLQMAMALLADGLGQILAGLKDR